MHPIYLPAHRLDPHQLARYSFTSFIPGFFIMFSGWGTALGLVFEGVGWLPRGAGLLFGFGFGILMVLVMRLRMRNMYMAPKRRLFQYNRIMVLDEEGFRFDYENGLSTRVPWSAVTGVKWTRDFLILDSITGFPMPVPIGVLSPDAISLIERVTVKPTPSSPR